MTILYILGALYLFVWRPVRPPGQGWYVFAMGCITALLIAWRVKRQPLGSTADLSLMRLRQAARTTETISALLSAALLWPTLAVTVSASAFVVTTAAQGHITSALLVMALGGAQVSAMIAIWLALDAFFCNAGMLMALVCLFASHQATFCGIGLIRDMKPPGDINLTLGIAFSLGFAALVFMHGLRICVLQPEWL